MLSASLNKTFPSFVPATDNVFRTHWTALSTVRNYLLLFIIHSHHNETASVKQEELFYLTTHSTHFIYGYMTSDMVKDHSDSERGNPLPPHGLLFPINSKDSTYHGLCYTSRGALARTRNSWMGPLWRIDPTTHRTMSERSYHGATSRSRWYRSVTNSYFKKGDHYVVSVITMCHCFITLASYLSDTGGILFVSLFVFVVCMVLGVFCFLFCFGLLGLLFYLFIYL